MSAILFQKRVLCEIFRNIQKCNIHNISAPRTFHAHMIFKLSTDPWLKGSNVCSLTNIRLMAGHAKWQNIKFIKAEKDRQKNITCNKYSFLIRKAAREGGKDPKLNNKLATIIEEAKKKNVSTSTIENALKSDGKKTKFGSVELLGPGGCIILIEYETDNISTIRHEIKIACKKSGAHVMSGEGRWRAVYEQKGILKAVGRKDGQTLDAEKALDDAILAGAEEVLTKEDEDNKLYLEFLCSASDLNPVKKEIERNYDLEDGYVGYLPIIRVELNSEEMASFETLLDDLGSLTDVIRMYENVQ